MKRNISVLFVCVVSLCFFILSFSSGCSEKKETASGIVPNVVTADIQAGIEKYIEDESRKGNGYFRFSYGGKDYAFKLVRVHTEYLANLGPRRHFACVDLVDTSGDVYDVDFFLSGDPGSMNVTETMLHKLNGRPFYSWKQKRDGTWKRVSPKEADEKLLGVISGEDQFEFRYFVKLPALSGDARMWVPFPESDKNQSVESRIVQAPGKYRTLTDRKYGNRVLFFELGPEDGGEILDLQFRVRRKEKAAYPSKDGEEKRYLGGALMVPITDDFRSLAEKVVSGKKGDLVRARALFDHVIDQMRYAKFGEGWGKGDAEFACSEKRGNCTDYHSYFMALARAVGIPVRFAIGASIPSSRNDGGVDGYHCWIEFHAEGKWWPVDISEADKYSNLSSYYFGHHPANRFEMSRGRDIVLEPGPTGGPMNFLAYPVLEVEELNVPLKPTFTFKRIRKGFKTQPL